MDHRKSGPRFCVASAGQRAQRATLGLLTFSFVLAAMPLITSGQQGSPQGKCPPATRKDDVVDTLHGVQIADPYRWLEDQNSPETRAWIEAQDACTAAALDAVPGRAKI